MFILHYSESEMFSMILHFVSIMLFILPTGASPLVSDAAPAMTDILCSAKFPAADTSKLKNLHTCLAKHNKDSDTVINIDSVKIDDRLSEVELYLPGETNGKTIRINCRSDEAYPTTPDNDGDVLEFDCYMDAELIVSGLIKNPTEAANKNHSTKECSQRSNLLCSSKECEDWENCSYTEMELRPPDIDDVTLGKGCIMIGGKTSRWMYDACGKLDCLCCRPFSYYDSKTKSCKACTAGGLPYPSPPIADACKVTSSDGTTASTSANFPPTIDKQTSTTATTVTQTTSTATEQEDLSTPGMHDSPYTTVEPGNSIPATDVSTDNHNHSPEETTIPLSKIYIGIRILAIIVCVAALPCYRCFGKDCNSMCKPGVRSEDDYSSVSTCPSTDRSNSSEENMDTTVSVSTRRLGT